MVRLAALAVGAGLAAVSAPLPASAFCGFYVGRADAQLFNRASQVAIVRDQDRTVLTMSNDYRGPMTDFALVVPVPTVLERDQIHVGEKKFLERLDSYSGPRLVEYFDPDPCMQREYARRGVGAAAPTAEAKSDSAPRSSKALGVTVEAEYTIGEYDIVLLSAKESTGLETWLVQSGYKMPKRTAAALAPYVRSQMKFFVAKVNLKMQEQTGFSYLRPIQIAFESPKFMLPIRLGMANADGPQDLIIYTLTRKGRVESTNYKTVQMPTGMDIPVFVKNDFGKFYLAAFEQAHEKHGKRAILTEYVWDMAWCDPCAAQPLTAQELGELGVYWVGDPQQQRGGGASNVVLTRMHVRYDDSHFPEDLVFQETGDRSNYQARYVLRHAFKGGSQCSEMDAYRRQLDARHQQEAKTLAELTGWQMSEIVTKMGDDAPGKGQSDGKWYKKLWK